MSIGIYHESRATLFSVDSFGAILPEATRDATEIPEGELTQGMVAWGTFDSPWTHLVQADRFGPSSEPFGGSTRSGFGRRICRRPATAWTGS
jgi:hypothetical protein